ncbi:MAG: YHS domain-containing protein [Balneolaceae bacterium]|nr:YHS domain-containing protein [Balneolaceae bacterium]MBO6547165.1 YHS domain-containing protein [Balneolaceae bacterium]MBO6647887.1 YHS domain-containing protein [Balneolaceae bacterium]
MKALLFSLFLFFPVTGFSQSSEAEYFNLDKDNLAIKGYDPVSYFVNDEPLEGQKTLTYSYNGATYRFTTQANLDTFKADPVKYEPAYGGWCAYAMGKGYTADINPKTYKIVDGKLLLFYNKLFTNTLPKWNKDEANLYPAAEKNWADKSFDR